LNSRLEPVGKTLLATFKQSQRFIRWTEKTFKKFRYLIRRNAFKNGALNAKDIDQPVNYPLVYRLCGEFKNAV